MVYTSITFSESFNDFKEELGKSLESERKSNTDLVVSETKIDNNDKLSFEDSEKLPEHKEVSNNELLPPKVREKSSMLKSIKSRSDNRSLNVIKRKISSLSLLTDKSRIEASLRKHSSSISDLSYKKRMKHDKNLLHKLIILNE